MPELPEVEVSRLGISPHLVGQTIEKIVVRQKQLRWPIPEQVHLAEKCDILDVVRRAKYLLIVTKVGDIVLHLGMSGKLCVVDSNSPIKKHDHLDIQLTNGKCLRLNDARRFGACLWQSAKAPPLTLLQTLGPEPLTDEFDAQRLFDLSRNKQLAVKNFIMDNKIVVGVGNIYANEALFFSRIDPRKKAGSISKQRYQLLTENIKKVLRSAIQQGGTTLKDFTQADGKPGYFQQQLQVYGRNGQACNQCDGSIRSVVIGQRNSFYCPKCQS